MKLLIIIASIFLLTVIDTVSAQSTFGPDTSKYKRYVQKVGTNSPSVSEYLYNNNLMPIGNDGASRKYRAFYQWDLTLIPDNSQIDTVELFFTYSPVGYNYYISVQYTNIGIDLTNPDAITMWDRSNLGSIYAIGLGHGNKYGYQGTQMDTVISVFGIGSNFCNTIQNNLENDKFILGITASTENYPYQWSIYNYSVTLRIIYRPPQKSVQVEQVLSNNINVDSVSLFNYSQSIFEPFDVPKTFNWDVGSFKPLKGSQKLINNEKYYVWLNEPDVINPRTFIIENSTNLLTSQFNPSYFGIEIKNSLEATSINGGFVSFMDPWLIDYPDSLFGYTLRNQGMDAPFKQRQSPFYPNYTTSYNGDVYQGVFLDQGWPDWQPPYYSVKAEAVQDTFLAHTGKVHRFYFQGWSADPPGSAEFQYANSTETPVVFRDAGATVQANLKGTQLTNMLNGYSGSSQRKAVTTYDPNEVHHLIYSSMNNIWYEKETYGQSGWQWDLMNQVKPLNSIEGKSPSIDYCYASFSPVEENYFIYIVFQNKREDGKYEIRLVKFDRYGSKIIDNPVYISSLIDYNSFDATPVVAVTRCNDGTERTKIVILWKRLSENGYPSGLCYYAGIDQGSNIQWADN